MTENGTRTKRTKHRTGWFFALCLVAAAITGTTGKTHAADANLQAIHDRLGAISDIYDSAESTLGEPSHRDRELTALRDRINPLRTEVRKQIETLEPRYNQTKVRLKEVGLEPSAGATAEDAKMAAERDTLTKLLGELDGVLKQARLLSVRGDQLTDRIENSRHKLFTERLFTRSGSILSPAFWIPAAKAFPDEARDFTALLSESKEFAEANAGYTTISLAIAAILAIIAALFLFRQAVCRRIERHTAKSDSAQDRRARSAYLMICRTAIDATTPPLAAFAAFQILLAFDLISPRIEQITSRLLISIAIFSIGCAATRAMLIPARKMIAFDDSVAARLYHPIAGAIITLAITSVLFGLHRILGAPSVIRTATSGLMALIVGIFIVRTLLVRGAHDDGEKSDGALSLFRFIGWIAVALIFTALASGHIHLASFTAARMVDAAIIVGLVVLLLSLIDTAFATGYSEEGTQRRKMAAMLGVKPGRLDFFATIIAGLLRALLFVTAGFLLIGGWRTSVTDVRSKLDGFDFSLAIGNSKIALASLFMAIAILVVGLICTRIVHRWLTNTVLPNAGLDTGLQNSIATMFVYLGVILAGLLALTQLGINLQNIALVAGALSVGIGFGLQSVVSNFVSGIILLAERPIRVGDIIVVKGEEGYVRRISVRSTEIETFDRANVIIPNSELISNVVKNWTHADTNSRITIKVGVSYDSDPDKVREILLNAANNHPKLAKNPSPVVLLLGFGDNALEFELSSIVMNVAFAGTTRSDLNFSILHSFRGAGIEIPFPQREYRIRGESSRTSFTEAIRGNVLSGEKS